MRKTTNTRLTATTPMETALSTPTAPIVRAATAPKKRSDHGLPAGTASSSPVTALVTMRLLRYGYQPVSNRAQRRDRRALALLGGRLLLSGNPQVPREARRLEGLRVAHPCPMAPVAPAGLDGVEVDQFTVLHLRGGGSQPGELRADRVVDVHVQRGLEGGRGRALIGEHPGKPARRRERRGRGDHVVLVGV